MKKSLIKMLFILLFIVLSYNIIQMPSKFDTSAPAFNDMTNYYIDHSLEDTGVINIVSAVLADYRAFDTLGETMVLFTSIVAVASILKVTPKKEGEHHE
ncbi:MAG: hydrogen gas-evolving membrane-bound hydrogenase subunit E [Candidatus Izemoplasmataceae bacterium]